MNAIVFICGCGHSGTSLLAAMFAAHPQVFVPLRETETFLRGKDEAAARYQALLAEWRDSGQRHLVEKTPRHISQLALIRELEPRARIVIPVRDGRDVAASMAVRYGDSGKRGIARWLKETSVAAAERGRADVFVYRHEDLVREPETMLRQIAEFCGTPFDPAMLDFHASSRMWFGETEMRRGTGQRGVEHRALRNWQINQPLFDSSGRWHRELTERDIEPLLTGQGLALMRAFAYL